MASRERVTANLRACCDALYRVLGEAAPGCGDDRCVVRLYEAARAYGDVSLARAERTTSAAGEAIADVLERARADETGAMLLYALVVVIAPRLLVTLRDVREDYPDDQEIYALAGEIETVTMTQLRAVAAWGEVGPGPEDTAWRREARELVDLVDQAGFGESFAVSR